MLFHHIIHDLEDWRQVFQDPDAFEPLIREIFRRHGLSFAGIGRCAPGSNAVFHCGGYIVKIFAPEESGIGGRDDFLTEKFGLLRAKRLSVPAPVLYAEGVIEDAHTFRYLLLEYVEGESLSGLSPRLPAGSAFGSDEDSVRSWTGWTLPANPSTATLCSAGRRKKGGRLFRHRFAGKGKCI